MTNRFIRIYACPAQQYDNDQHAHHPDSTSIPTMNKISLLLLVLVAFAVAGVVGLLVLAPEGMVENPPGSIVLPYGLGF